MSEPSLQLLVPSSESESDVAPSSDFAGGTDSGGIWTALGCSVSSFLSWSRSKRAFRFLSSPSSSRTGSCTWADLSLTSHFALLGSRSDISGGLGGSPGWRWRLDLDLDLDLLLCPLP